jgi:hypothetical protein
VHDEADEKALRVGDDMTLATLYLLPGVVAARPATFRGFDALTVDDPGCGGRLVAFYNKRGTCEQWIKEGKGAIKWTRLSCCSFAANAVRLQLHALAYNLANFMRTLALP